VITVNYASLTLDSSAGTKASEVVEEADMAMYLAKHHGKDRFEVFAKT
jgi:GGDEF domain-containing protein